MESSQDYDLWIRLSMKYPVNYIDAVLLRYHMHSGQRITTDAERKIRGSRRLLSKYNAYYSRNKYAWYKQCVRLQSHYLRAYGRKKAFGLWIRCVGKCPGELWVNFKQLVKILFGSRLYDGVTARIYRKKR